MKRWRLALLIPALWSIPSPAAAAPTRPVAAPQPSELRVVPAEVRLTSRRDYRQVVVSGLFGGEERDLTQRARFVSSDPKVIRVVGGRVEPAGDGSATLAVRVGTLTRRVPVRVTGYSTPDPVRFHFETIPLLTRQGCSSGSCHGSPRGRAGFSLSLYGYDPEIDRVSLTRDGYNRRINVLEPSESLLLKKPLLEVSHGGGKRLRKSDPAYRLLHEWIAEGATVEKPAVTCTGIEIAPGPSRVLKAPYLTQQLCVVARFSDGSSRDVTGVATFESTQPAVAVVDGAGLVTARGRGQAAISVRYLDFLSSAHITMIEDVPGFAWKPEPEPGFIDRLVNTKLRQLQVLPSEICTDSEFIRRVSLDLTGLLPQPDRTRRFLADASPDKRARLVDELLETDAHARFWALKRADLFRVTSGRLPNGRADKLSEWIYEANRTNLPYDRFARTLLTASGESADTPTAGYFVAIPTMEERTEMTAQIFMGSRLECARCHNHPFESWTMRDYYSLAAVFARVQVANKTAIRLADSGDALLPTTREAMKPWGAKPSDAEPPDRRTAFVDWLARAGNPFFARVEVNRMWSELFGRGIVDPVDDFRSTNPPSNAALLDALGLEFERSGFDRRHMLRLICRSRAYQRSSITHRLNVADESLFSHAKVRLLTAEQLQDAIGLTSRRLPPPAPGSTSADARRYATQRSAPENSAFTLAFGQPKRETACTCERSTEPTLLQALELLNGGTAFTAATLGADTYAAMTNDTLVRELYLSAFCRDPSAAELKTALQHLSASTDRKAAVVDLLWSIMNTREFLFQH